MLFREMYGLEIVAGIVFFGLGLLLAKTMARAHSERIQRGLEEQARLREAVSALRGGGGMGISEPVTSLKKSPSGSRGGGGNKKVGKLFGETEAAAGDGFEGKKGANTEVKSATERAGDRVDAIEKETDAQSDLPHLSGGERAGKITQDDASAEVRKKVKNISPDKGSKVGVADQIESAEPPALSTYETAVDAFAGEGGIEIDRTLGVIFAKRPKVVDDLKAIKGIGAKIERQLHAAGVYRIAQIAHWNDHNAEAFGTHLRSKGRVEREEWILQAKQLYNAEVAKSADSESEISKETVGGQKGSDRVAQTNATEKFAGEDVTFDKELGVLFRRRPKKVDDLTRIKGIGKVLSGRLNKSGVYRFQQIALWTPEMVEAFSQRLKSFQDRMRRDRWIEQASQLHREEHGE